MPKKTFKNNNLNKNLSNIIKRLPLHQRLNDSQNALIKFSPVWQQWSEKNISPNFLPAIALNSFKNGLLIIRCTTPTAASQLKHLQVSLLDSFHTATLNEIKQIKIQIDHTHSQTETNNKDHYSQHQKREISNYKPLKSDTITNIQNCKRSIKSEKLSHSLERLATTLARTHKLEDTKKGDK